MKLLLVCSLLSLLLLTGSQTDIPAYKNKNIPLNKRVEDLLSRMTLEEKVAQSIAVWQLVGAEGRFSPDRAKKYTPLGLGALHRRYLGQALDSAALESNAIQKHFIENTRLGIPVLLNTEGLHGLMAKNATVFPGALGLGSTWDEDLFQRVYEAVALETRALGIQQIFSPNLDIVRDPRWGRTDENFGEDTYLTSRLGVAFIKAAQGKGNIIDQEHVAATAKHFAVHGQPEGGYNQAPVNISEREIRTAFLPPFEAAIKEANVRLVMASYNEVDGVPSHKNKWLLRDILRKNFGFNGVIISDYGGIDQLYDKHFVAANREEAAKMALTAGVDFDLSEPPMNSYPTLVKQIKEGKIPESLLNETVRRILRLKFELGLFENPYVDASKANTVINNENHKALALEAAHKSIVLLKNEKGILPLNKDKLSSVAVIGPNSNVMQFGAYAGINDKASTLLDGIVEALGKERVKFAQGCLLTKWENKAYMGIGLSDRAENLKLIEEAVKVAKTCDVTILAIGGNTDSYREGLDRSSLDLIGEQNELVKALLETGKPVVVLLFNGQPLCINDIEENAPAIVECWHPGEATGTAVADVLFGKVNPSGKLPITFPTSVGKIPSYYNRKPSAKLKYFVDSKEFLYPFGYGLSYTTFEYSNLSVNPISFKSSDSTKVTVTVKNKGKVAGDEIVQLYIHDLVSSVTRPVKELKSFRKIHLSPGEMKDVTFYISAKHLAMYNEKMEYVVEPGEFKVMVGSSSKNSDLLEKKFEVAE